MNYGVFIWKGELPGVEVVPASDNNLANSSEPRPALSVSLTTPLACLGFREPISFYHR